MRDIGARAGVHYSTVSLALRNNPTIPEHTRIRIQELAREMGFQPDPVLARLAVYRQSNQAISYRSTLAIITERQSVDAWRQHRIGQRYYQGITERANELGYEVESFRLAKAAISAQRLRRILITRNISGILVAPLFRSHGHLSFDWSGFSAVTMGFSLAKPALHRVAMHHYRSVRELIKNLRRLGHRRIAFSFHSGDDERLDHAWSAALLVERLRRPREEILYYDTKAFSPESFGEFLAEHRPTVVAGTLADLLRHIQQAGYQVPDEISFVNMTLSEEDGTVAGMFEDSKHIGALATDLLVSMILRNEKGVPALPHIMLVEGKWIEGQTIRAVSSTR